jgi:tetratricopeptide (TPR) repeat protein
MVAAALVLVGVSGLVGYKLMHRTRSGPTFDVNVAQSLVNSGRCAEAMEKQITPALAQQPNDEAWRKLRDQCAAPPPTSSVPATTTVPQGPTVAERLDEAEKQIAAKDCQTALAGIAAVLTEDPNNDRAKELSARATACTSTAAATSTIPVEVIPPSKGGLPKLPRESDKDHKDRMAKTTQAYEDAVALLQTKKYLQAKKALDDLAQQVPADYRELAQRREDLARAMATDAKNALQNAQIVDRNLVDKAEDFDAATALYRRAHDLDPSISIDAALRQLNQRRIAAGQAKCTKGKVEYAVGNNAGAAPLLQDAVKLLSVSTSDSCYEEARQILLKIPK